MGGLTSGSTIIRKSGVLAPVLRLGLNFCAQCLRLAVLIRRDEPRIFRPFSASIVLALTMIAPVNLNNQS
jgi:hypothetical protein